MHWQYLLRLFLDNDLAEGRHLADQRDHGRVRSGCSEAEEVAYVRDAPIPPVVFH